MVHYIIIQLVQSENELFELKHSSDRPIECQHTGNTECYEQGEL